MSGGRVLARNAVVNLVAQVLPLAVALVAIPVLIGALGPTRFAIVTLVWGAIGYFGLFDLGIGRALTHALATRLGRGDTDGLGPVTWTALALMSVLGVVGGIALAIATPPLIDHVLNVPPEAQAEGRMAFYVMAAAIPATLVATGLRGILEAYQDFPTAAALRIPLATLNFLAPLAVLPFSHGLVPVVLSLGAVRVVGCALHLGVCMRRYAFLRRDVRVDRALVAPLLRYGGWLTVTNVVSPLMASLDRFIIGAILPMAAVTFYVTPFEVASKLFVIPTAVLAVLFPAVASTFAGDEAGTASIVDRGMRVILIAIFPATLALVCLAHEGLALWINAEFARQSTPVLQWLAVGVLINCGGQVAFTAIQGVGRPDLTGKTHLAELPLYMVAIWSLTHAYGIVGVAIAWTLRVSVDTTILFVLTARALPAARRSVVTATRLLVVLTASLAGASLLPSFAWRLTALVAGTVAFAIVTWLRLIQPSERAAAIALLSRVLPAAALSRLRAVGPE